MNELPTLYQQIYYVYFHVDPETDQVVYVGKGSRGRAWHCAESNSRSEDHAAWMNNLLEKGYTPDSWVRIIESGLTDKESYKKELKYIHKLDPKFNSKKDYCCKLSSVDLITIKSLREDGLSYYDIGNKIGLSTMTVYRALTGKTRNYVI